MVYREGRDHLEIMDYREPMERKVRLDQKESLVLQVPPANLDPRG